MEPSYLDGYLSDIMIKLLKVHSEANNAYSLTLLEDLFRNNFNKDLNEHSEPFFDKSDQTVPFEPVEEENSEEENSKEENSGENNNKKSCDEEAVMEPPEQSPAEEPPLNEPASDNNTALTEIELNDSGKNSAKQQPFVARMAIQPEILQTHDMVIIRVRLPENMSERDIKITINGTHAAIKWLSGHIEQIVPLPDDIIQNSAKAIIKGRVLEVQIQMKAEGDFRQIPIF